MENGNDPRSLKVLRAFSVSKRADTGNEDRWCASTDGRICAVSDGASVSFDPGPWAHLLSKHFIEHPEVSREWLQEAIAEYNTTYDRETMQWMHQAAFDRGSFATLLGIVFSPDWKGVRVFAMGDTILALVDGEHVVRTIPYIHSDEFDRAPDLFSTNPFENRALDDDVISNAWHELNITSHGAPTLLLMTDALGRWLLDQPDTERVSTLLRVRDDQSFLNFVEQERAEGRLRRDDTTLVVVG